MDWKLDSKSLLKGYLIFFWNGSDDKWRFYQGRYHGLDAPKDAAKDALKDAPDDSSIVEENQVIEDVNKGDACKECKKKMTVASLYKYVILTRLKPIATILLQNFSVKVKAAGIIWHFYEDLCFNK